MKIGSRSEEHCLLIELHCVELSTYYVQKVKNAKMLQLDFFLKSTHTTRFLHYLNISEKHKDLYHPDNCLKNCLSMAWIFCAYRHTHTKSHGFDLECVGLDIRNGQ